MPALRVRRAASNTISSASQREENFRFNPSLLIPFITHIPKRETPNGLSSPIEIKSGSSSDVGNQLDMRMLGMATSEQSSVDEDAASESLMRLYFRRKDGFGRNAAMAPSIRMRETKSDDRRRPKGRCFRSQCEAYYATRGIIVASDGRRKSPRNDDRERGIVAVIPRVPTSSLPTNSMISTASSDSTIWPMSLIPSSGVLPLPRTPSPSLLAPSPILAADESSSTRTGFSAGTVIALSTVLPAVILLLLGVIIQLLRTRNRPRPMGSPKDQEACYPMADVRHPERSFDALEHRPVSPFNLSMHDLVFGRSGNSSKPGAVSMKSHVSSDSGHAVSNVHADQPSIPPIAITRASDPVPPPTPVLAVRYTSKLAPGGSIPGNRTSIYVDRTSMDASSATASTVVFAHPALTDEASSVGRPSRDEPPRRWSLGTKRTSTDDPGQSGRPSREDSSVTAGPSSGRVSAADSVATGGGVRPGPRSLKLPGIGPPLRVHLRSQSQPTTTYGLPSLQLPPRIRTRQTPGEALARSPMRPPPAQEHTPGQRPQRIHSHRVSASLSTPISASSILSQSPSLPTAPPPRGQDRRPLSIVVPPRLGAPIRPVAELAALQTPSTPPQQTPRITTPRTAGPRTPASALSIQDALGLPRPRGMSDLPEPSAETRERILRLLGRLPEEPSSSGSGSREGDERRSRDVRRTRSEGRLHGQIHDTTD